MTVTEGTQKGWMIHQNLARSYLVTLKTSQLHDLDNDAVKRSMRGLIDSVNALMEPDQPVQLQVVGHMMYVGHTMVRTDDFMLDLVLKMEDLTDRLELREITFLEAVDEQDIIEMLRTIQELADDPDGASKLRQAQFKKIRIRNCGEEREELSERMQALHTYLVALLTLKKFVNRIQTDRPATLVPIKRAMQQLVSTTFKDPELMLGLITMPRYRGKLFRTLLNTAVLTMVISKKLGLSPSLACDIAFSAALHDLDWTNQSNRKTTIRQLARIYQEEPVAQSRVLVVAGMGDPDALPTSQLVTVASAYERLTSGYNPEGTVILADEALRRLEAGSDTSFSPVAVEILTETIGVFPVGSAVELGDGSLGIVVGLPDDGRAARQPVVRIVRTALGERTDGRLLDLTNPDTPTIVGCLSAQELNINAASVFLA